MSRRRGVRQKVERRKAGWIFGRATTRFPACRHAWVKSFPRWDKLLLQIQDLQIQDLLLQIRVPWRGRNTLDKIGKRSGYFQIRRNMSCRSAEFVLARWLRRSLRRRHPEHLLKSLTLDLSRNRGRSSQGRPQSDRLQNLLNLLDALRRPPLAAEKNLKLDR